MGKSGWSCTVRCWQGPKRCGIGRRWRTCVRQIEKDRQLDARRRWWEEEEKEEYEEEKGEEGKKVGVTKESFGGELTLNRVEGVTKD